MRILGIDPSSTICGAAIVDSPRQIRAVAHWKRNKTHSHPQGFVEYHIWLGKLIYEWKPDMAVIEMWAYSGPKSNAQVSQAVGFYQAVSALCCKLNGLIVIESRVSSARKAVLGKGNLSKDEVWEIMKVRHNGLFSAKTSGGLDESDALVLALAGPTVAER